MSPHIIWGLGAAIPAITAEYLFRVHPESWLDRAWIYVPLGAAISYCVYRLVTLPDTTLIDAFIVFTLATIMLRVLVSTLVLGDVVKTGTWIALGLVVLARVVQVYWR